MQGHFESGVAAKQHRTGWFFLLPATLLIVLLSFYPIFEAFLISLKKGSPANLQWQSPLFQNYIRMIQDKQFILSIENTFLYLLVQVPVMLILAILLA